MAEGYKWIKIYGNGSTNASLVVGEMQILDGTGNNIAQNGEAFGSSPLHSNYPPAGAFSGKIGGYQEAYQLYISSSSPAHLGYRFEANREALQVRLGTSTGYDNGYLKNGVVLGSNDSTDGFDGTWDTLASPVSMSATKGVWVSIPLTWGPNAYKEPKRVIPTPIILSTMPATLSSGFSSGVLG